jgi:hypothetical protein
MTTGTKDIWDKVASVGTLLIGTLIPLTVAIYGGRVSEAIKDSESNLKYVEIATSLIREEPKPENEALRLWAIDVLAKYAKDVPLSETAKDELRKRRVPVYSGGWGNTTVQGGNYTDYKSPYPASAPNSK